MDEAVGDDSAVQIGAELLLDVPRKAAFVLVTRGAQKLFEVPADEFVEISSLGAAGRVARSFVGKGVADNRRAP